MSDILLNFDTGDIIISDGDISLCKSDGDSYIQNGNVAVQTPYGENQYHEEYGNKLWITERVSDTNYPVIEDLCTNAILSSNSYIQDVVDVHVELQKHRIVTLDYKILLDTILNGDEGEDILEVEEEISGDDGNSGDSDFEEF